MSDTVHSVNCVYEARYVQYVFHLMHVGGFYAWIVNHGIYKQNAFYIYRRIGENPVDVTKVMNPFKVTLMNDNNEPLRQVQRGDPYFFNVESSGKFPGKWFMICHLMSCMSFPHSFLVILCKIAISIKQRKWS